MVQTAQDVGYLVYTQKSLLLWKHPCSKSAINEDGTTIATYLNDIEVFEHNGSLVSLQTTIQAHNVSGMVANKNLLVYAEQLTLKVRKNL